MVVAAALVTVNVAGWRDQLFGSGAAGAARPIRSLAVLPLENLSGDPEQEYFVDGMTDALIADLAKIGALRVISRTSAMRYKETEKPLPEIARELNVDAVVEGADLSVGSRRVPGGGFEYWPWHRRCASGAATAMARWLLRVPLTDPMSGYFVVKRPVFERVRDRIRPKG